MAFNYLVSHSLEILIKILYLFIHQRVCLLCRSTFPNYTLNSSHTNPKSYHDLCLFRMLIHKKFQLLNFINILIKNSQSEVTLFNLILYFIETIVLYSRVKFKQISEVLYPEIRDDLKILIVQFQNFLIMFHFLGVCLFVCRLLSVFSYAHISKTIK